MKLEKTLLRVSVSETIILSIFLLVAFNSVIFLFSVAIGKPKLLIYDSAWISQIAFPILYSIMQTSVNRNGVLKITDYNDLTKLTKQIEFLILRKGYIAVDSKTENIKYAKKTKWGIFFNYFFKENINVRVTENEVLIFARRNILAPIVMTLKYGKTNG